MKINEEVRRQARLYDDCFNNHKKFEAEEVRHYTMANGRTTAHIRLNAAIAWQGGRREVIIQFRSTSYMILMKMTEDSQHRTTRATETNRTTLTSKYDENLHDAIAQTDSTYKDQCHNRETGRHRLSTMNCRTA